MNKMSAITIFIALWACTQQNSSAQLSQLNQETEVAPVLLPLPMQGRFELHTEINNPGLEFVGSRFRLNKRTQYMFDLDERTIIEYYRDGKVRFVLDKTVKQNEIGVEEQVLESSWKEKCLKIHEKMVNANAVAYDFYFSVFFYNGQISGQVDVEFEYIEKFEVGSDNRSLKISQQQKSIESMPEGNSKILGLAVQKIQENQDSIHLLPQITKYFSKIPALRKINQVPLEGHYLILSAFNNQQFGNSAVLVNFEKNIFTFNGCDQFRFEYAQRGSELEILKGTRDGIKREQCQTSKDEELIEFFSGVSSYRWVSNNSVELSGQERSIKFQIL